MGEAFYEADGDRLVSTELTRGPWDPQRQHAGPPAALLGRELEHLEDAGEFHIARVTCDMFRTLRIRLLMSRRLATSGSRRYIGSVFLNSSMASPESVVTLPMTMPSR